jgi:hypothetical protein
MSVVEIVREDGGEGVRSTQATGLGCSAGGAVTRGPRSPDMSGSAKGRTVSYFWLRTGIVIGCKLQDGWSAREFEENGKGNKTLGASPRRERAKE